MMEKRTLHLLTLDPIKGKLFLTSNISYNKIVKRGMFSRLQVTQNLVIKTPKNIISRQMGVRKCYKFQKNSQAQKDLSSDDKGKHSHLLTEICDKSDCNLKKCPTICGNPQRLVTEGHMSHKPIAGKFSKFVNDIDANGQNQSQYMTKNTDKKKEISSQKEQNYLQKKEMKKDQKMENYCNKPEIKSKLDDE